MKLYLLRHGRADWPAWEGPDDERPLTEEGAQETRRVAAALKRLKVRPGYLLSSPLPRASQTARLVGEALDVAIEERVELEPGFARGKCDALLASRPSGDIMLVGHEPDFSTLIRSFTGASVKFPKAATAAIEIPEDSPAARLLWLFPAKALIRLHG